MPACRLAYPVLYPNFGNQCWVTCHLHKELCCTFAFDVNTIAFRLLALPCLCMQVVECPQAFYYFVTSNT